MITFYSVSLLLNKEIHGCSLILKKWKQINLFTYMTKENSNSKKNKWSLLTKELDNEKIKLLSFDETLIKNIGNVKGKRILDYGSGTGIIAKKMKDLGADVKAYDISSEMLRLTSEKIGIENTYSHSEDIPENYFDVINCSLVLCIVTEKEVSAICSNIKRMLNNGGSAYFGFCNPKIFHVKESQLDYRLPTGNLYSEIHTYEKIKKEGNYKLFERHRPIEWYENVFKKGGLRVTEIFFTPEYSLMGNKIKDFIIFKVAKD
jgi:2-polyprenyl-3-methyl-5-hydroxy-6-metoxy-1,4-benzoquinol methylase